ncbi:FAD/NAD(P)-binding domain-containing protein [Clathrospora elynae]|uniref:FAD/NAD(P)-binding domain-containing protein n=1 Tax=Clathrospora elynae TaxID=706981 RepID=A0A6A5SYU9_9PLEO|nr:FAD/NAD(P)-binding domain-containing protein [Clathrospora elynae]
MPLNILIVGAGVCGPALALLLQRSNPKHTITVIERFPSLRTGGQQIDLKAQGIPIMKKLGLLETVRSFCVNESGMEVVDKNGTSLIRFGVTGAEAERGAFEVTNEFEFMRGDFVKMFHDVSLEERDRLRAGGEKDGGLRYEFGTSITALNQSTDDAVNVTFSSGEQNTYDLVVAADGQSSRTRRLAFGEEAHEDAFKSLNIHAALFNIPRIPSEDSLARLYVAPGDRAVMTRSGDRPATQVYLFVTKNQERAARMKETHKLPLDKQKQVWSDIYADAGWDCPRFLAGMQNVEDFYATEVAQVKMPHQQVHKGRVVLLGDAGYCPSAFTGNGTTLSLIGAHVLAGELAKHGSNVDAALKAYEDTMKQPIEECQKLSGLVNGKLFPSSAMGIRIFNSVLWTLSSSRVDKLLGWLAGFLPQGKEKGWELPEYS